MGPPGASVPTSSGVPGGTGTKDGGPGVGKLKEGDSPGGNYGARGEAASAVASGFRRAGR